MKQVRLWHKANASSCVAAFESAMSGVTKKDCEIANAIMTASLVGEIIRVQLTEIPTRYSLFALNGSAKQNVK